jgi:hypothetical protein
MLWEKWIPEKYIISQTICGLEIILNDHGMQLFYTIAQKRKNRLNLLSSGNCESLDAFEKIIKKQKIPFVIGLNGKGLVFKKVVTPERGINYDVLLNENYPTLNISDFYIQLYRQVNCDAYVNLFRKEQIDTILNLFKEKNIIPATVFLGYGFVADAIPLTTLFNSIKTNNSIIEFSNSCIENIRLMDINDADEGRISVEGIELNKKNTFSFSLCFAYLLNTENCYNYNPELEKFKLTHRQNAILKIMAYIVIGVAFTVCLINFFFFTYYFNKSKELDSRLHLYEGKYEKITDLINKYESQKNIISESGLLDQMKSSKYADKIASTIPKEVVLSDWVIGKQIKGEDDSLVKFKQNAIEIKGWCNKSLIVNEWVNILKSQNFIKDVNLLKFSYNNEGQQPNFELNIITE